MNDGTHSCWLRFASSDAERVGEDGRQEIEEAIETRLSSKLPEFRVSATLRSRQRDLGGLDGLVLLSPNRPTSATHEAMAYARELLLIVLDDVLKGEAPVHATVEVGCDDMPFVARLLNGTGSTALLTVAAAVFAFAASLLVLFGLLRWSGVPL